jgi:4'-phosphopantetheinyl transferase EntD
VRVVRLALSPASCWLGLDVRKLNCQRSRQERQGGHLASLVRSRMRRVLFCVKEAVYKAVYPLDQKFLDHHDVEIDFAEQKAYVCNGRIIDIRFSISSHIVALALSSCEASS